MANMIIGWSDWGDEATIDESSAAASGFPVDNVKETQPTDFWDAATGTPYIVLDRGSAAAFDTVALLYTDLSSTATWRVRAADDKASLTDGTADYDSTSVTFRVAGDDDTWPRHHGLIRLSAAETRRWIRIDIDTDGAGGADIGRLIIGSFFQPDVNDAYGRGIAVVDPSTVRRTDAGVLLADARTSYLRADVSLRFLSKSEALDEALSLLRQRGLRNDVLFCADPAETTYLRQGLIYGRITQLNPVIAAQFNRYELRFSVEEML